MTPTYTAIEIIEIICLLDLDELAILGELITEEIERYTIQELSIIHANFFRQVQRVAKKEADRVMEQIWVLN